MGIEPTPSAWEAEVLPLNYTRLRELATSDYSQFTMQCDNSNAIFLYPS